MKSTMTMVDSKVWWRNLLVLVWPGVMLGSMTMYWWMTGPLALAYEVALQVHFLCIFVCIFLIERILPHASNWKKFDRQGWNDFLYNVTFPVAQIAATLLAVSIVGQQGTANNNDLLGLGLPFILQFVILVLIVDLIWYIGHRAFHTVPMLWRLHALHHNSSQLHVLNNSRVHPLEVFALFLPIMLVVVVIDVPLALLNAYFAFQLTVGLLTHSNLAVKSGWLSRVFNTPELHRWHHSWVRKEHDNNYGSVSMVWDHLFGTYFNPRDRTASVDIGVDTPVPVSWFGQLAIPFRRRNAKNNNVSQPE
jgi:sterol desaturase/sphingolipid hydroxylase (fatty acid hydroxylase superfamily)